MALDIKVRLVSGAELKFTCTDEEAKEVVEVAGPTRLGAGSRITINAEDSTFIVPAAGIERMDFINGNVPKWKSPAGTKEMRVMTEAAWKSRLKEEGAALAEQRASAKRGDWCPGFAKLWFQSGEMVFVRYTEIIGAPPDKPHAQKMLFSGRPIHAENEEGGWTVINCANALTVRFFPRLETTIESDWRAKARNGNGNGLFAAVGAGSKAPEQVKTQKIRSQEDTTKEIGGEKTREDETRKDTE